MQRVQLELEVLNAGRICDCDYDCIWLGFTLKYIPKSLICKQKSFVYGFKVTYSNICNDVKCISFSNIWRSHVAFTEQAFPKESENYLRSNEILDST